MAAAIDTVKSSRPFRTFDCVRLRDGRIGRVRAVRGGSVRVRVRRRTSATHQFLNVDADELKRVACPKGWMTPSGYGRYLRTTLAKMRQRRGRRKKR